MKKIVFCAMLLIIATATFSQQTKTSAGLTKQDYLEKSKNQKKAADIMLIGGVSLMVGPVIFVAIAQNGGSATIPILSVAFWVGSLSILTSVPFYIAAHGNKKKGMSLSFKNETVPQLQNGSFTNRTVPSLALKISL